MTIWVCPCCRSPLALGALHYSCASCTRTYAVLDGIPDFRLPGRSWLDAAEDLARARKLLELADHCTPAELVRQIFSQRVGWDEALIERRTAQVLAAPARLRRELDGWLRPVVDAPGPLLDLGCGNGTLLCAAADAGVGGIGIDVSMTWLVVAKRLIATHGGKPLLACALGEALPLADESVGATALLDVIEHVADPASVLIEIERVTCPGGRLAVATPNRFSLAPEPHVGVWGVGWLPRALQARYVGWWTRRPYSSTHLLSTFELRRLLRRHTTLVDDLQIPRVPEEEIAQFGELKARLARFHNRLAGVQVLRWLFLVIAPFFRIDAVKPEGAEERRMNGRQIFTQRYCARIARTRTTTISNAMFWPNSKRWLRRQVSL